MRTLTNYDKTRELVRAFKQPLELELHENLETLRLRKVLIEEEFKELMQEFDNAFDEKDQFGTVSYETEVNMLKEAVDLLVVTYGLGATFGWEMDYAFSEVQRSNLSKLGEDGKPIYREDGKVLKGPNYSPANVEGFI